MVEARVWSGVRAGVLADGIVSYLLTGFASTFALEQESLCRSEIGL